MAQVAQDIIELRQRDFARSNAPLNPEAPLDIWLLGVVRRCARRRAITANPSNPAEIFSMARETVFDLFHAAIPDLLKSGGSSTSAAGDFAIGIRIDWAVYRDLARRADYRLAGKFHPEPPSSLSGSATIAEAGGGVTAPGGSRRVTPEDFRKAGWGHCPSVPGVNPHRGWHCGLLSEGEHPGLCDDYVALHEDGRSALLNTCRFNFNMTDARWRWIVEAGFPGGESFNPPTIGPMTNARVDAEIARAQIARAAA